MLGTIGFWIFAVVTPLSALTHDLSHKNGTPTQMTVAAAALAAAGILIGMVFPATIGGTSEGLVVGALLALPIALLNGQARYSPAVLTYLAAGLLVQRACLARMGASPLAGRLHRTAKQPKRDQA